MFKYELIHICKQSGARFGRITTNTNTFYTPIFMPVGTNATVKTLSPEEVLEVSSGIILSNTYHLYLNPGVETIKLQGGVKKMMNWKNSLLTDSGGFQVFSLGKINKITNEGVNFKNPKNGDNIFLSPEISMDIQYALNSDIMMAFDECVKLPCSNDYIKKSIDRTYDWAIRCVKRKNELKSKQALFGIFQGGLSKELRLKSLNDIFSLPVDGIAIGGLSVGESRFEMYDMLEFLKDKMPKDKPRYLMGVGEPKDFLKAILEGVDMMDCVMPSRNARHGSLFTTSGKINIKNSKYKNDLSQIDSKLNGWQNNFNKSYLHHLFKTEEILGQRIATYQNLCFMKYLTKKAQEAICEDRFLDFYKEFIKKYN